MREINTSVRKYNNLKGSMKLTDIPKKILRKFEKYKLQIIDIDLYSKGLE